MKKFFKIFGIILLALIVLLGGYLLFFHFSHSNSFYGKTYINGVNVSNTKLEIADTLIKDSLLKKDFIIYSNGKELAKLNLKNDLDVKFEIKNDLKRLKNESDSLDLFSKLFDKKEYTIDLNMDIQQKTLEKELGKYDFMKGENYTEPQNAFLDFSQGDISYKIADEVIGTTIVPDKLYKAIQDFIQEGKYKIDLLKDKIYEMPEITKEDENLKKACEEANQYLSTVITYKFADRTEVLDKNQIQNFFTISDENVVAINSDSIKEYVKNLSKTYNSAGATRNFTSTKRGNVIVSGGDYGYIIDIDAEVEQIVTDLKNGKAVEREPIYSQTGLIREENDIGKTYVEIDLTNQHIWFYYEGTLVIESDCVTGTPGKNETPPGVYALKYKQANAVLKGDKRADGSYGYEQPVSYWMPFNGGIGLHDATWRGSFGGNIYKTNGSHGCVNLPKETAANIFGKIQDGTPIILYQ